MDSYQYGEAAPGSRFTFVFNPKEVNIFNHSERNFFGGSTMRILLIMEISVTVIVAVIVILFLLRRKKTNG